MTQKIVVIKVHMDCDKCRKKAMKLVAAKGVDSVAIHGEGRDHLTVIGDGIDPVNLVSIIRRKVAYADIVKVDEVDKDEDEDEEEDEEGKEYQMPFDPYYTPYPRVIVYRRDEDSCCIM